MTTKKDRRCPNCTRFDVNCRKPNRVVPKYATECRKWSEKPQKPIKCKACYGRGLITIGSDVKGLSTCPMCNGTGFINCTLMKSAEFLGTEFEIKGE